MTECESCHEQRLNTKSAVVNGRYYKAICAACLGDYGDDISSGGASYNRRRDYEDSAQDTVQPYDAMGQPRLEFLRLYPEAARKTFTDTELAGLQKKL